MRLLGLVPARGGSKRLPGKNIRPLGGIPLLQWTVNGARDIEEICDILVSTDSPEIAKTALAGGALVPWLRPEELATDTASSLAVCLHALDWYEGQHGAIDGVVLLQPSSPFRRRETVEQGIGLFREHRRPVVAVSPALTHPSWCYRIEDGALRPYLDDGRLDLRSQDLPPAYAANGTLYIVGTADLRRHQSLYGDGIPLPLLVTGREESLDIDTAFDWAVAEMLVASMKG